jgi:hypothetical protein
MTNPVESRNQAAMLLSWARQLALFWGVPFGPDSYVPCANKPCLLASRRRGGRRQIFEPQIFDLLAGQ